MRRHCSRKLHHKGFVLLQTMWLLILASVLTFRMMSASMSMAKNSAAAVATFQVELAAESAVHQVAYDLLTLGVQSPWPKNGQPFTVLIDSATVSMSVVNANGLVDVNAAEDITLQRIIGTALTAADASTLVNAIKAARPIADYATLEELDGMSSTNFKALFPYITLYSRQTMPSFTHAPAGVVRALYLKAANGSVLSDTDAVAGITYRIEATARAKQATSRKLSAELLLTGRLDQSYWVYDWSWHSHGIRR